MVSPWTRLRLAVDPLVRPALYTAYRIGLDEYVDAYPDGTTLADVREDLRGRGYEPQYLSAAKYLSDGQPHDLSYRRVPETHPDAADETPLADWRPEQAQYHVHVFRSPDSGPLVFSHYELKPDLWPLDPMRLRLHYRPPPDYYLEGVTDLDLND